MKIISLQDIDHLAEEIKKGKIAIFPFDTCYGLVGDATNQQTVDKIRLYKAKNYQNPIPTVYNNIELIKKYTEINESGENFIKRFLPGPFTLILRAKPEKFAKGVISEKNTIGVRIPNYEPIIKLVEKTQVPLTATSANKQNTKIPYQINDITKFFNKKDEEVIDYIVDVGILPKRLPSTVVDLTTPNINVLRKGNIKHDFEIKEIYITKSEEETINLANNLTKKYLGEIIKRPLIFAMHGDMGAGKTHFAKGIAKALQIDENIKSPTFTIINEYIGQANVKLVHMDTWRLGDLDLDEELHDLDFDSYFQEKNNDKYNVIIIEWIEKVLDYIKITHPNAKIIWIEIEKIDDNTRKIIVAE
ncbi:MAG: L-threonylcarbamoyladenylate synthase [Candidatus Dojkabacteria bacterium]|nr:L-threonylcarbamoyladenylate synthase [Candidatus Dojkabacteria bacterium]